MPMDSLALDNCVDAGALIQYGLCPQLRPANEPEYRRLLRRYEADPEYQEAVSRIAEGLGLRIIEASHHGVVLAPEPRSTFAMRWSEYRPSQGVDNRMLNGLIFVAIMAAIFPRAADLEDDPLKIRHPVTVDEIESEMRSLCAELETASRNLPDPTTEEEHGGLSAAWRVYNARPATSYRQATRSLIEKALEFLAEHGCFQRVGNAYRATWRFHVLVQQFSVETLYTAVQTVKNGPGTTDRRAI